MSLIEKLGLRKQQQEAEQAAQRASQRDSALKALAELLVKTEYGAKADDQQVAAIEQLTNAAGLSPGELQDMIGQIDNARFWLTHAVQIERRCRLRHLRTAGLFLCAAAERFGQISDAVSRRFFESWVFSREKKRELDELQLKHPYLFEDVPQVVDGHQFYAVRGAAIPEPADEDFMTPFSTVPPHLEDKFGPLRVSPAHAAASDWLVNVIAPPVLRIAARCVPPGFDAGKAMAEVAPDILKIANLPVPSEKIASGAATEQAVAIVADAPPLPPPSPGTAGVAASDPTQSPAMQRARARLKRPLPDGGGGL